MRNHVILFALICIIFTGTVFACNSPASSSNITSSNGPVIEAQYTLDEVLEIARDFSPECRKRIPPQEGAG